ncbi:hypothetical protein O181_047802 [Austropuccinia psidii MF-1]|uniref:Cytochrome b5 heme-binding domain-containing protein n=1 Tax=Austropuccinia psidii MF-1 TaxID=1389203 RepID=A0A9Q3DTW0_9BASI|nr:hypothetical protein [Austropuccinia psidii MF-1]
MIDFASWIGDVDQLSNPLNVILLLVALYTAYPLLPSFRFLELSPDKQDDQVPTVPDTPIAYNWKPNSFPESIAWRTYTPVELKEFDGSNGTCILFAVNRVVYDVSAGRNFYGPDGPYGNFAGRDATRGLAKQSFDEDVLTPVDAPIDTLQDLTEAERENLSEWEGLFKAKYIPCGELIENSERSVKPL